MWLRPLRGRSQRRSSERPGILPGRDLNPGGRTTRTAAACTLSSPACAFATPWSATAWARRGERGARHPAGDGFCARLLAQHSGDRYPPASWGGRPGRQRAGLHSDRAPGTWPCDSLNAGAGPEHRREDAPEQPTETPAQPPRSASAAVEVSGAKRPSRRALRPGCRGWKIERASGRAALRAIPSD